MILSPDGHCRPFDAMARRHAPAQRRGHRRPQAPRRRRRRSRHDPRCHPRRRHQQRRRRQGRVHRAQRRRPGRGDRHGAGGGQRRSPDHHLRRDARHRHAPRRSHRDRRAHPGISRGDAGRRLLPARLVEGESRPPRCRGRCRRASSRRRPGVLNHREIPPLVNFRTANPRSTLDTSPFVASASASPWDAPDDGAPRRAGVSSFGIGGTNAHVVLEEAPRGAPRVASRGAELLVLSAKTPTALDRATADLAAHLRAHPELSLADVAFTLGVGRQPFAHRRAVVVRTWNRPSTCSASAARPPVLTGHVRSGRPARRLSLQRAGQPAPGHGRGPLSRRARLPRRRSIAAPSLLEPHLGLDLRAVLFPPTAPPPRATRPSTRRASRSPLCSPPNTRSPPVEIVGDRPRAAMIGHSVGEYVAAHLAGVFSLDDALAAVAARGRLMHAQPPGEWRPSTCPPRDLAPWLKGGVEVAAVNAPGVVHSLGPHGGDRVARPTPRGGRRRGSPASHVSRVSLGDDGAVARAVPRGARAGRVLRADDSVRVEPHRNMDHEGRGHLPGVLRRAPAPRRAVRSGRPHASRRSGDAPSSKWGPGTALTSLARLTLTHEGAKRASALAAAPARARATTPTSTLEAAGRVWIAGVPLAWPAIPGGMSPRRVPWPTYPFERKRHWVDALAPVSVRRRRAAPKSRRRRLALRAHVDARRRAWRAGAPPRARMARSRAPWPARRRRRARTSRRRAARPFGSKSASASSARRRRAFASAPSPRPTSSHWSATYAPPRGRSPGRSTLGRSGSAAARRAPRRAGRDLRERRRRGLSRARGPRRGARRVRVPGRIVAATCGAESVLDEDGPRRGRRDGRRPGGRPAHGGRRASDARRRSRGRPRARRDRDGRRRPRRRGGRRRRRAPGRATRRAALGTPRRGGSPYPARCRLSPAQTARRVPDHRRPGWHRPHAFALARDPRLRAPRP